MVLVAIVVKDPCPTGPMNLPVTRESSQDSTTQLSDAQP